VHPRLGTGQPDYSRLVPCQCSHQKLEDSRLQRLQSHSNLGSLTRLTFDNLIPQGKSDDPVNQERFLRAYRAATAFAAEPEGWLVFTGPSGSGKTHLAAAIANQRLSEGHRAIFEGIPDLLDHLRSTFSPNSDVSYDELFLELQGTPLLVLDDLGVQSSTPWAEEKLFQLINQRSVTKLPTVINVAAGVSLDDLEEKWRTRLADPGLAQVYQLQTRQASPLDSSGVLSLGLLKSMTFDTFEKRIDLPPEQRQSIEKALHRARVFAEAPEDWLVLQGDNGCGKTHLAAAIANYCLRHGRPVCFVIVPEFLDHLRATFGPDSRVTYDDLFEKVKNAPLLILDDYGEHSTTPWAKEKLYQIINYRYNARLPMVVTMCCSLEDLDREDRRVGSRLADHKIGTVFAINAPDFRVDHPAAQNGMQSHTMPRRNKGRSADSGKA